MAKYEMATEKPSKMDTDRMLQLSNISFAPYIQLSTMLIGKQYTRKIDMLECYKVGVNNE